MQEILNLYDWKEDGIYRKKEVRLGSWSGVREIGSCTQC